MMATVFSDGFSFDFPNAIDAFKFDETDKSLPTYHGAALKAVDVVAEFKDYYLFIEVKNFDDLLVYQSDDSDNSETFEKKNANRKWLKNYLKYKFRDTFLYRFAEGKVDKPIRYICLLINLDTPLCAYFSKELRNELPVGNVRPARWKNIISESCTVLNLERWQKSFPDWAIHET